MRRMIWITAAGRESWVCSECNWEFLPSGPPIGASLDEMKVNYEIQGHKEFVAHVCAEHPTTKRPNGRDPKAARQRA